MGLVARYYRSLTHSVLVAEEGFSTPFFEGSPHALVPELDDFEIRWAGFLIAPKQSEYTINLVVASNQDKIKLWLDQQLVINQWNSLSSTQNNQSWSLSALLSGPTITFFTLEYNHQAGEMPGLQISWEHSGGFSEPLTREFFRSSSVLVPSSPYSLLVMPGSVC